MNSKKPALEDKFQGIGRNKIARMRPGIIEAADKYGHHRFKAHSIDSEYRNSRIGWNMNVLAEADIVEVEQISSRGNNYYITDSLEPAKEVAEQAFRYQIIEKMAAIPEHTPEIVEDLEGFKIYENIDGDGLIHFHGDEGYHEATVWLLEELNLIEDNIYREFTGDSEDFEILIENTDDWREIAENLGDGEILPEKYIDEMNSYLERFPKISYSGPDFWTDNQLRRLRE